MAGYETLLIDVQDGIGTITMNRPNVRNAINNQVRKDLGSVLDELRHDDNVGAVVFTGAGDKAFVAGADIGEFTRRTALDVLTSSTQELYDEIEAYEKPTIAAVNGYALGGGCELALACDIRIASENARFGLPETTLAVLPGAGGTQRLARLIGKGRALEMIMTGRFMPAEEALTAGLVTKVVSREELAGAVKETVEQVLAKGPLATRLAKLAVQTGFETDQKTGLVIEKLALALLFDAEDKNEGAVAFLEKRKPNFKGR